jgi:hypothetical protein
MNSIDDVALTELFDTVLLPMAQHMHAAGMMAFPLKPEVRQLSYYVTRRRCSMAPADFRGASCADIAQFEERLAAHWNALGRHELAAQAALFAHAAHSARALHAPDPNAAEVSPYVYAMF